MGLLLLLWVFCTLASGQTAQKMQNSFLGGEISPLMSLAGGQLGNSGLRTLENALVIDTGAVTRRPGSVSAALTAGNQPACLFPFIYSETDAYVLEFTAGHLRFYRGTGLLMNGSTVVELTTPYQAADLFHLQCYQSADRMFIVNGSYSPRLLTRTSNTVWTIEDCNTLITNGPWRDTNTTDTAVDVNAVTGTGVLHTTAALFHEGQVGGLWQVSTVMATQTYTNAFTGTADGASLIAGKTAPYKIYMSGTAFRGTLAVQVSYDEGSTWDNTYLATNPTSMVMDVNTTGVSDYGQNVLMRMSCTAYTSGSVTGTLQLSSYVHSGVVRLTGYTDPNHVSVTVEDRLGSTAGTTIWAEGAWSDYRGYPSCVGGHFGRLVFAKDLTFWWSGVDDFLNFQMGTNADEAFSYTLSSARQDPVRWIVGEKTQALFVGTVGKVMELRSLDELNGFTPTNPPKLASSSFVGSANFAPVLTETSILFADREGLRLRELYYDASQATIITPDLTQLASHITGTGLTQLAVQVNPYPIIWCVRADGQLATLYYCRPYQVAAWSRQVPPTGDFYGSVCVVPLPNGLDRVWTCVQRGSNYCVEYFADLVPAAAITDAYYVDSGASFNGGVAVVVTGITRANPAVVTVATWPASTTPVAVLANDMHVRLTGLGGMTGVNDLVFTVKSANAGAKTFALYNPAGTAPWDTRTETAFTTGGTAQIVTGSFTAQTQLNGRSVVGLGDGAPLAGLSCSAGTVTLADYYNKAAVGLAYTTTIQPLEVDLISDQGGTAIYEKRLLGIYANAYCTAGGRYGIVGGASSPIVWPLPRNALQTPQLFTGATKLRPTGGTDLQLSYAITQAEPLPLTLRALVPLFSVQQ